MAGDSSTGGFVADPAPDRELPTTVKARLGVLAAGTRHPSALVLTALWILTAAYVMPFRDRGWIPHDEGCLAHSAERVLEGELPHRDFDEIYTGALSYLHGLAFQVFGKNLRAIRWMLFLAFLIFVPVLYAIARRFAPPMLAAAVVLSGVLWSFPNYFAGIPSWYNLLFAATGVLCLFRHVETGRLGWVFAAGLCGGISFLFKLVGLYFVVAAALFLLYREGAEVERRDASGFSSFPAFAKGLLSAATLLGMLFLIRDRWKPMEIAHFVVPPTALCLVLMLQERKVSRMRVPTRLSRMGTLLVPLAAGVALPVFIFLIPYFASGSVSDFLRGVFVLPQRRLGTASFPLPPISALLPAVPFALLLAAPSAPLSRPLRRSLFALLLVLLGALLATSSQVEPYRIVWFSVRSLAVVVVLAGCVWLFRGNASVSGGESGQKLFLLLAVVGWVSLVQFPFAAPIYFCYVAPLVGVALLGVVRAKGTPGSAAHVAFLVFYVAFAVLRLNRGYVWSHGLEFRPYAAEAWLEMPRGGLRVPFAERERYAELLRLIDEKVRRGTIYAAPDSPEVYFLSARQNPTRSVLDFNSISPTRGLPLFAFLKDNGVRVIVINRSPDFSKPIPQDTLDALERDYPHSAVVGEFLVRWRV